MKRGPNWSNGILVVMLGIVFTVMGLMQALMLPLRGAANWSLMALGLGCMLGGFFVARRAASTRDRSLPANEKRIPSARVHRSARR